MAENTTTQPKQPPPPTTLLLGKYEQGKLLGHGSFAKVYLAKNLKTHEFVAIKVLDKEKIIKGGFTTNIKREIAILRRVRHPNIVKLLEVMATKSKIFFVMEFVKGGQLFNKVVSKGRLNEDLARKYFQQLISAVKFCHDRGVYHRDLKPENLLLDENGDLKVSDFGLSTVSDRIQQDGLFHTLCGTPAYVAPEVLAGKGYDASKFDLWSCGIILFVLMAGYLPFHDSNVMVMYKKICKGEFKCPRWFSPDLVRLLRRMLDRNPDTRITIPQIMENRWFKKGFQYVNFYVDDNKMCTFKEESKTTITQYDPNEVRCERNNKNSENRETDSKRRVKTTTNDYIANDDFEFESDSESEPKSEFVGVPGLPRPTSLNAFDIISFSRGFDLSGLFDEEENDSRFVSGAPVSTIISKLEEIARVVRFAIRVKDCRVNLEGSKESAKGKLALQAEVFELTPSLSMVEIKKQGGDKGEYEEFYHTELLPSFENISITKSHSCSSVEFANSMNLPSDTE